LTIAESATGVGLIAVVITLLFSLYQSFQRREELVITLDAVAGAPPSGVQLLETVAEKGMSGELERTFLEWRGWSAAVLESHLAYPLLIYFRSSHDNEAWLNSFGAVMDAAILVMSTVEDASVGVAELTFKVGRHLIEDFGWYLQLRQPDEAGIEKEEFIQAVQRLKVAGYKCRGKEQAWPEFQRLRSMYWSPLNELAHWLAIIPAQWIGDRSYLPHRREPRQR
jgi:hypothetical protein